MSVLVATDFAHATSSAVHMGAMFAAARGEELRLMHVVDFTGDDNAWRILYETADEIEDHATQEAVTRLTAHYRESVPEEHHRPFTTVVRFGRPADGILEEASQNKPSMIVVGTVGQSFLQDVFFGRTSNQLVRQSHLPVLTVPPKVAVHPPRKILVAMDLSECGQRALEAARAHAASFGAAIELVYAVDVDAQSAPLSALVAPIQTRVDEVLDTRKKAFMEHLEALGAADMLVHVEMGRPDRVILEVAERMGADLVVMGSHGRQGFSRFFLGSTAERALRSTKKPVLVVSAPAA